MRPEDELKNQTLQPLGSTRETVRDQDKIMLVLSYLGIFALIPLLTSKDSPFVQWHAKQGTALFVVTTVSLIVVNFIPLLGQLVGCVGVVGALVVAVMGMVKALNGDRWRIPLVADLAEKF